MAFRLYNILFVNEYFRFDRISILLIFGPQIDHRKGPKAQTMIIKHDDIEQRAEAKLTLLVM